MAPKSSLKRGMDTWPQVIGYFVETTLARSVARERISKDLREDGLLSIMDRYQLADALKYETRDTLYNPTPTMREKLADLYDALDAPCLKAIDESDPVALRVAYEHRHKEHVATSAENFGRWIKAPKRRKGAVYPAVPTTPSTPEEKFLKRIAQLGKQGSMKDLEPGFLVAAWHRLPFVSDEPVTASTPLPMATRVGVQTTETEPRSTDSRFATLEMRCETNATQPWPVNLDLTFGKSHPEAHTLAAGWVEFRFAKGASAAPAGERRRFGFPNDNPELVLQVMTGGGAVPKSWRLQLSPGGTSVQPNLAIEHAKMSFPAAITIRSVLMIGKVCNGEMLTAALVLPLKDQA